MAITIIILPRIVTRVNAAKPIRLGIMSFSIVFISKKEKIGLVILYILLVIIHYLLNDMSSKVKLLLGFFFLYSHFFFFLSITLHKIYKGESNDDKISMALN